MKASDLYIYYKGRNRKNLGSYLTFHFNIIKEVMVEIATKKLADWNQMCQFFGLIVTKALNFATPKDYSTYLKLSQMLGVVPICEADYKNVVDDNLKEKKRGFIY